MLIVNQQHCSNVWFLYSFLSQNKKLIKQNNNVLTNLINILTWLVNNNENFFCVSDVHRSSMQAIPNSSLISKCQNKKPEKLETGPGFKIKTCTFKIKLPKMYFKFKVTCPVYGRNQAMTHINTTDNLFYHGQQKLSFCSTKL